jgi:hypothetical protein
LTASEPCSHFHEQLRAVEVVRDLGPPLGNRSDASRASAELRIRASGPYGGPCTRNLVCDKISAGDSVENIKRSPAKRFLWRELTGCKPPMSRSPSPDGSERQWRDTFAPGTAL